MTLADYLDKIRVVFPLYFFPENNFEPNIISQNEQLPDLVNQIAQKYSLIFTSEKETEGGVCFANSPEVRPEFRQTFAPLHIWEFIYAVLHSSTYRKKQKGFLTIDFSRVPYPQDAETFWQLVNLGSHLRQLHLFNSPETENYITKYPEDGSNVVDQIRFQPYIYNETSPGESHPDYLGAVYINRNQYFADVPTSVWDFYIGGYQTAQKWLKDRKGRELSHDDILHYQKIIVALSRTTELRQEIDTILNLKTTAQPVK